MRLRVVLLLLAGLLLAVTASACGGGEEATPTPEDVEGTVPTETEPPDENGEDENGEDIEPVEGDIEAGRQVFAEAGCGGCHMLADANATGTIGVDLDEAEPSFDQVETAVREGPDAMPSFEGQLTDEQIRDVSAYVAEVAGG
jgi:cytochrome c553